MIFKIFKYCSLFVYIVLFTSFNPFDVNVELEKMVVNIAAIPDHVEICIYDIEFNKFEFKIFETTVQFWETSKVEKYFEDVMHGVNKPIDYFYLIVDGSYYNEILKCFVEASKKYEINNLKIMSRHEVTALISLKYISADSDSLWNFVFDQTEIDCAIWKIHKLNVVSVKHSSRERYSNQQNVTKENLKKLLKEIKMTPASPTVVVFYFEELDTKNALQELFDGYESIHFKTFESYLFKLLCSTEWQKRKQIIHTIVPNFSRQIIISSQGNIKRNNYRMFGSAKYTFFGHNMSIPFHGEFDLRVKQNDTRLKIYEGITLTQTINIKEKGTTIFCFQVDINGIFNIYLKKKKICLSFFHLSDIPLPDKLIFRNPRKQFLYYLEINAVGIDIGTAECCASVIRTKGPETVALDPATHNRSLPSYVDTSDLNTPCGQVVVNRMETKAQTTAFDSKRFIGKELKDIVIDPLWPFELISFCDQIYLKFKTENGEGVQSAAEICRSLLKHIKEKIEEFQGTNLNEVVITVPSAFTEKQIDSTIDAALGALMFRVDILPEPVAALIAYSYEGRMPNKANVLLYDSGDGTTDICIATITDQYIKILIDNGDFLLGAKEFDRILINYFGDILKLTYQVDLQNMKNKYRLMSKCRDIKHTLSIEQEGMLDVDNFIYDNDEVLKITRTEFETMATDLIQRGKNLIIETMRKAKLHRDKIDIVFLGGGGSRVPMVKEMLKEMFPDVNHYCSTHPEELVAKGAALYAYELAVYNFLSQRKKSSLKKTLAEFLPNFDEFRVARW